MKKNNKFYNKISIERLDSNIIFYVKCEKKILKNL